MNNNLLCRIATEQDVPAMKELWKLCFGDEDAYIDRHFRCYYENKREFVAEAEGQVVSMLITFPFYMTDAWGEMRPACYIYAFCTHPDFRGKGYGRELLSYAEKLAKAEGCIATIMIPGEKSLFDFYQTLGYSADIWMNEETMLATGELSSLTPKPCFPYQYRNQRECYLDGICHIIYPRDVMYYQQRLSKSAGGDLLTVGEALAAVEVYGDTLMVKELLSDHAEETVSALLNHFHCQKAVVRTPVTLPTDHSRPFGVVKYLDDKRDSDWYWAKGWLAFAFD